MTATLEVLDGRVIVGKTALDAAVAAAASTPLSAAGLSAWDEPSRSPGRTLGQALVSPRAAAAGRPARHGLFRRAGGQPGRLRAGTDQWLGHAAAPNAPPRPDSLVRRYLRCYAPPSLAEFAAWAGIGRAHAEGTLGSERERLVEVRFAGRRPVGPRRRPGCAGAGRPRRRPSGSCPRWTVGCSCATERRSSPIARSTRRCGAAHGWPGTVIVDGLVLGRWRGRVHGPSSTSPCSRSGPSTTPPGTAGRRGRLAGHVQGPRRCPRRLME